MEEPSLSHALFSLVPFLVVTVVFFFFGSPIGGRQGKGIGIVAWS